ncbi:MAG: serine hydrolase [Planctomycetia bacterium]|nr:serine hydrolase [Planctomycetia bacterium]
MSIALVDDQRVVWSKGYGKQDREGKVSATDQTIYRVGSVSKLFTDVAIMQLVEEGKIDLDAPVTNYLPDFKPLVKPEQKPITLRMLMSHRSGLIRESPVGNYFDPTRPTLEQTVASVNGIPLVYSPGEKIKYSNAAIAAVGLAVQKVRGEEFTKTVEKTVLGPLGMKSSSFSPDRDFVKMNLAAATMWTYHGREFPAPTFELGMAPAGCMYSTVTDLGKFLSCLFADGKTANGRLVKPETLAAMLTPQFAPADAKEGFGIGFALNQLDGKKRIGHGGAIYGFSTELAALPTEKLGVVVVSSRDVTNAVTSRIADDALRLMLAAKAGRPLPELVETKPLEPKDAKALVGRHAAGDRYWDIHELFGKVILTPGRGGFRTVLRADGAKLRGDDAMSFGPIIEKVADGLKVGDRIYQKVAVPEHEAPRAKWLGLIGEYGWDHNTLYILERDGKLNALIEWVFLYPLTEESENVFAFPDFGLYHGEKLVFARDKSGRATKVEAASVTFHRRKVDGENGETFRIQPVKPLAEIRTAALTAKPPAETGDFRKSDLVDLATIDPTFKFDIRYATDNNFLGAPVYTSAKAFMQKPAAEALGRVGKTLATEGLGLWIYDAYRPWYVTKMFWDATPEKFHDFVADPSKGSRHNRGCAVDLGLYDLKTGKVIEVVSGYDEFSDRAYPDYVGGTSRQRWHRDRLRRAMEAEGFTVYEAEWWHFDFADWRKYGIQNESFEQLAGKK